MAKKTISIHRFIYLSISKENYQSFFSFSFFKGAFSLSLSLYISKKGGKLVVCLFLFYPLHPVYPSTGGYFFTHSANRSEFNLALGVPFAYKNISNQSVLEVEEE